MPDNFINDCVARFIEGAAKAYREEITDQANGAYEANLSACESPLEEAFWRCWCAVAVGRDYYLGLTPQVEVRPYRLDFAVVSRFAKFPRIAIELDGHEFHEATKAQATWRNRRDRALQASGWTVFRISGSEFWHRPYESVDEVYTHAEEEARVLACEEHRRRA